MQRRSFFGAVFAGLGSAASAKPPKPPSGGIPTRTLGRTGQKLTIIGMGGARFHLLPFEESKALVRRAYDMGINYFDMARNYWNGHAEEVYGAVIPEFRKNIFLTSKTNFRPRKEAEAELDLSLKLMKTDHLDLWQIHGVNAMADIPRITAPGGTLEAFVAARKAGKCRFIGFTGHANPAINVAMMKAFDGFDTTFMPLHAADTQYLSFERIALPEAEERGYGIFAMKVFANAYLLRTFSAADCLRYALSLPITAGALGMTSIGQLEDNLRVAQNFKPLSKEQMDALRAHAAEKKSDYTGGPALEYWKKQI